MRITSVLFESSVAEKASDDKQQSETGTYAGLLLSEESAKALRYFVQDHDVPEPVSSDIYHVTLLHSKKYLPEYEAPGILERPYIGHTLESAIWETSGGQRALVVKFECSDLLKRHEELMDTHEAQFDYDEYQPHVTLSYDIGDWEPNLSKLDYALNKYVENIVLIEEYEEALEVDWVDKKKGKKKE